MAIVELSKLSVIGMNDSKNQILSEIMELGVVEICNSDDKLTDEEWSQLVTRDGDEKSLSRLEIKLSETSQALEVLEKYDKTKKPLIKVRKPMKHTEFEEKVSGKELLEVKKMQTNNIYKEMNLLKAEENHIHTTIESLKPWISYDLPLDMIGTLHTNIFLGTLPISIPHETIVSEVDQASETAMVYHVSSDEQLQFFSVVCLKEDTDGVIGIFRKLGFNLISFDLSGNVDDNLKMLEEKLKEFQKEIAIMENDLRIMAMDKGSLEIIYDDLVVKRDRTKILSNIVRTDKTFHFDGWFPKSKEHEVKKVLEQNGCYYEMKAPEKGEETPILLKQNVFSEPFEAITNLYSVPSVNDIDPTPFLAPFYFIFFGMMLSDAGYGIIMAVGCFILLKKFKLEGMMKKLIKMFYYCGISTIFWGIMFGGYFGDFIQVAAKSLFGLDVIINPAWFNPIQEPMKLLMFSLILGAVHLFFGMGLKAYLLLRNGKAIDALCDIFLWYVLLAGLVLFGLGIEIGKWMSLVGVVGVLLTGGRRKKSFLGKIAGGLGSLYGITGYLSDLLSYSRLLALGLATGVVAQVINTLGGLAGGGIVGAIALIFAFVIGHTFNLSINALGSFVHSSRLQYVEFFGKFFEGGGTAFNPFYKKMKYFEILKEEK